MAVTLLAHEVSDLCLGKPALRALSVSASIADALSVLRNFEDNFISVWDCEHSKVHESGDAFLCQCIGKICMVDVICYLCKDENSLSPSDALKAPVSVLLPKIPGLVVHVEPSCSLLEAIDLMLEGAQNLVVPIKNRLSTRRKQLQKLSPTSPTSHNGRELLLANSGRCIISSDIIAVDYDSPALLALEAISRSLIDQTSVAVVDTDGILIGEISPLTLGCCDETVAAAITTLSSGDLMAYIDCGGPPEDLVRVVKDRLKDKGLEGMLEQFNVDSNLLSYLSASSSSDEESMTSTSKLARSGKHSRSMSYSARIVRRAEAIVCHAKSSLVAVMIQAIAHRGTFREHDLKDEELFSKVLASHLKGPELK
ncbi:hypothetical protein Patl1_04605 [Pistacia atlantica]|uniref:Uncharacterized protein n=1 Tax=Pistacia atlantica TaxID=434234 RepID=A0ACC1BSC1_9ROSI|nr:hypothetical protein Patl1_04605 [Pistacia atlantica]